MRRLWRGLKRRFVGDGWLPVQIGNTLLVACSFAMILCLLLPFEETQRRQNGEWHTVGQSWGITSIAALVLAAVGGIVLLLLRLGTSPSRRVRNAGRAATALSVLSLIVLVFALVGSLLDEAFTSNAVISGIFASERTQAAVGQDAMLWLLVSGTVVWLIGLPIKLVGRFVMRRNPHAVEDAGLATPPRMLSTTAPVTTTPAEGDPAGGRSPDHTELPASHPDWDLT